LYVVWYIVAVPCDHVKWAVALLDSHVLPVTLDYNIKEHMEALIDVGDCERKVGRASKAVTSLFSMEAFIMWP